MHSYRAIVYVSCKPTSLVRDREVLEAAGYRMVKARAVDMFPAQKEVIHDWMNHFNPILNKYNTVKKELKAKVTERKELNVQKDKTSILNPIRHIKLNHR